MPYCCRHMPARQHTAKKSRGEAPVRQKGKNRPPLAIPPGDRTRTRAAPRKVESFRRAIQEKTRPVPCRELRERPFSATPPCGKKRFRDGQEPPADWPPKTAPEDCPGMPGAKKRIALLAKRRGRPDAAASAYRTAGLPRQRGQELCPRTFSFETLHVPNPTVRRFAEKTRCPAWLGPGGAVAPPRISPFAKSTRFKRPADNRSR